jgi:hypothetical protein
MFFFLVVVVVENAAFFLTTSIAIEFFLQLLEYIIQQSKKESFLGLVLVLVELLVQSLSVTLVCLLVASSGVRNEMSF